MTLPAVTERLVVRELTPADLDGLAGVFGDPAVLWWEPAPFTHEQSREALERTMRRYREDGFGAYAVVLRATDELIGVCGLVLRDVEGERLPELGWDVRSDHWGRGYATEAARAVLAHAADLGLRRVYSLISPDNERSRGVARNLGMTVERQVMHAGLVHDLWAASVPVLP
jgi:RimJ/RimL family protein N-acetyltransferase